MKLSENKKPELNFCYYVSSVHKKVNDTKLMKLQI